ncbi:MAG: PKD domain-containing protein [Thermoplasmata archaeon]|nr:PKD domain-containing protein [Thermoplasmata archaeon]
MMIRLGATLVVILFLLGSLGSGAAVLPRAAPPVLASHSTPGTAGPPGPAPSQVVPAPTDWAMYQDNPERTGANLFERTIAPSNVSQLHQLWTVPSNGSDFSAPIVVNGTVYYGSWNGYEYAVNASNGTVKWKTFLGTTGCGGYDPMGISSTPEYVNGTLYVGGGNKYWYALNATNGSVDWRILVGTLVDNYYNWESAFVYNDSLFIGTASCFDNPLIFGQLLEVNLTGNHNVSHTFNVVPTGDVGGSIWTTPAVDAKNNTLWVATGNENPPGYPRYTNAIVALNASTLNVTGSWQVPNVQGQDSDFGATPNLVRSASGLPLIVATNKNGVAYALNRSNVTSTGSWAPIWSLTTGGIYSSGAFDGTTLYLDGSSALYAVNPGTGNVTWSNGQAGGATGSLAWANGLVYVGANSEIVAVDAANGTQMWNATLPGGQSTVTEPVVADGQLYVASGDYGMLGYLTAYGLTFNASATAAPLNGTAPLSVNFTAEGQGGLSPYSFRWVYGDGTTGTGPAPTHLYRVAGNYTARVWINDSAGGSAARAFSVSVHPSLGDPNLTASISASKTLGVAPLTVLFTGTEQGGVIPPYNFSWDFADGARGFGPGVSHTFRTAGPFKVNLLVRDNASNGAPANVTVDVVEPLAVVAHAGPNPTVPSVAVGFNASVTGGLAPFAFLWDFGDTTLGTNVSNPSHIYTVAGNYTATLVVTDALNERASSVVMVGVALVVPPLSATPSYTYTGGSACGYDSGKPLQIVFDAGATGGVPPLTYNWSFSDHTTATGAMVVHAYVLGLVANLTVRDADHHMTNASVTNSMPPSSSCPPSLSTPNNVLLWVILGGAVAVVALLVVALAALGRRGRKGPGDGPVAR